MEASRSTTVIFDGGNIEIPANTIAAAGIHEGDELLIEAIDGSVVMRRRRSRSEVDEDVAAARTEQFESDEAFGATPDRDLKPPDQ